MSAFVGIDIQEVRDHMMYFARSIGIKGFKKHFISLRCQETLARLYGFRTSASLHAMKRSGRVLKYKGYHENFPDFIEHKLGIPKEHVRGFIKALEECIGGSPYDMAHRHLPTIYLE